VTDQFGAPTVASAVNAYFFHLTDAAVTTWRATQGTASFTRGGLSGTRPAFPSSAAVTCHTAGLNVSLNVTTAMSDDLTLSSTRSATLPPVDVSGIIVRMLIQ